MKYLPPSPSLKYLLADYKRSHYHIRIDANVPLTDVLRPGFWTHHYDTLNVDDIVDVVSETLDVQLRVFEKAVGLVKMRPRMIWVNEGIAAAAAPARSDEPLPEMPEGYEIKKGPRGRWRVMQKDPLIEVAGNIVEERDAILAARAHYQNANAIAA